MSDVAAIVLAAGLSRRMGNANKLMQPLHGQAIVKHVVQACLNVSDHPVTVVIGHEADVIRNVIAGERVHCVENPSYKDGQMTSVDAGLRAAPDAENYLLALGDQPFLSAGSLAELLAAHDLNAEGRITVPFVDGTRGNPIVIPAAQRTRMLTDPVNLGCRKLTRTSPELVHMFSSNDRSFVFDIDTPDDLRVAVDQTKG